VLHEGSHVPVGRVAQEARTVGDMFRRRARQSGDSPAYFEKKAGRWAATSWQQFYERACRVAAGIQKLGVERGERCAILGPTQPPWAHYDMGAQLAGAVSFGIYPKQSVEQIRYLLEHSEARIVFVDEREEVDNVLRACEGLGSIRAVVPWREEHAEAHAADRRVLSPARFDGEPLDDAAIERTLVSVDPEDTAILVYTSGTTGPPKGAMITHRNILAILRNNHDVMELYEDDTVLSFLPMAHAAERILGFFGRIDSGIANAYATSMATVLEEVREVRPSLFGSVPRIYEKAYAKIHAEAAKKPRGAQRIFALATRVARRAAPYKLRGEPLPLGLGLAWRLFDRLIYTKIREAFGGRVRWSMTGAAPIAVDILELFWGAGIPIFEAYGMTESTVITHANRPGHVKLGTVGRALECAEHRIADDGEVLVRGPIVFKGYFKNEAATRETVIDGWLHTGDIGSIDGDGFLRITDRKKHLIITAGGKNLSPANIENAIKTQDPLISQVHAHGDRRSFVSAVLAPSPIETLELGAARGVVSRSELEELSRELLANPSWRPHPVEGAMARVG
jgi:long-chain acyl-CoA synthetase